MEQLNKKIKDIYNKAQTPLPPEFNWDDMKEGIFEKIAEQEDKPMPFYINKLGRLSLVLMALIFLLLSSSIYFLVNDSKKNIPQSDLKNEATKSSINKLHSTTLHRNETEIRQDDKHEIVQPINPINSINLNTSSDSETIVKIIESTIDLKSNTNNKKFVESTTKLASNTKSIIPFNHRLTEVIENELTEKDEIQQKNTIYYTKKQLDNQNEKDKAVTKEQPLKTNLNSNNKVNTSVKPLIQKKSFLISNSSNEGIIDKTEVVNITNKAFREDGQRYHTLQFDGGINNLLSIYQKEDNKPYETEVGFASYYVNASYQHTFANGVYLSAGFMWSKLKTKFELSDTLIHNFPVKDALTKRIKNAYTNNHIRNVYEDIDVPALASRQVRHYNNFDALSLPFIVGKRFGYKKLTYHIGIGTDVSLFNQSEGRTLRDNKVINYSKLEEGPYHNGIQISALAETGIGISISQQMEFLMHFRYKQFLRNWSNDGLVVKPQAIMLGTGLRFNF